MYAPPARPFHTVRMALAAAAVLLLSPVPVTAQYAHFFKDAALTPDDIELAHAAARSLYAKKGVTAGEKADWHNAESGAEGVVEVLEVEEGGTCVVFRHLAKSRSTAQIRYYVRRCLNADGEWVLSAN